MSKEALAKWDTEMRRFASLSREEQIAEVQEMVSVSVMDTVREAISGSVADALR